MSIPRPEHPRPQFMRDNWMNLNGKWDFLFDFGKSGIDRELYKNENFLKESSQKIVVPFCPESSLSGIGYTDFIPMVWYRRTVNITKEHISGRVILHFGAVDHHAFVYVNNTEVGNHVGGYSSFEYDITDYLFEGENTIIVCAEDDTRSPYQQVGKQSVKYHSHLCSYTRTTGIWQTVWLEFVEKEYIKSAKITPFTDDKRAIIEVKTAGGREVTAKAFFDGNLVSSAKATVAGNNALIVLELEDVKLWDVGKPNLYDLVLSLDGKDTVKSYFGMRKIELKDDGLWLNDNPLYMKTILDQGFNPDGIYTAPDDNFLKRDIELAMELGFNGARLHMRVFEERTLYWADHYGYIVWGEYPTGAALCDYGALARTLPEWIETVSRDYNHPSIIGWCHGNESYWQKDLLPLYQENIYEVTKKLDPYRPCIDAAGGVHYRTDMYDVHEYEQDASKLKELLEPMISDPGYVHNPIHQEQLKNNRFEGQPYWISEYGGTYWNPFENQDGWGYGNSPKTEKEFAERYKNLTSVLLNHPRICGFCYTQLTDIEQEKNGLYLYDRTRKFSDEIYEIIRKANEQISYFEKKKK